MTDVQSAWSLLLHCASARANYILRVVRPDLVRAFAAQHEHGIWQCCCEILGVSSVDVSAITRDTATLPLALGGLGLRSATRTSLPAFWASWADCLSMIHKRHPTVAETLVRELEGDWDVPTVTAASDAARVLSSLPGFELPSWFALVHGTRPLLREPEDHEPGASRSGWQHEASIHTDLAFRGGMLEVLADHEKAFLRSQSGPGAGVALSATPSSYHTRIDSQLFRVLLLRRLRLPLSPPSRFCRCGRPFDALGHHRAACARTGVLGRRGFAVESAAARICREAGGRVTTNVMVRDLNLAAPNVRDARRLEVVVDGLPLFGGAQLAVDTTLVSALHCDGSAIRGAAPH